MCLTGLTLIILDIQALLLLACASDARPLLVDTIIDISFIVRLALVLELLMTNAAHLDMTKSQSR